MGEIYISRAIGAHRRRRLSEIDHDIDQVAWRLEETNVKCMKQENGK